MKKVSIVRQAVAAGVIATATMDAAGVAGRRAGAVPSEDLGIERLGRWVGYLARGKFTHERLSQEPQIAGERELGLLTRYLTGTTLAVAYLAGLRAIGREPTVTSAVAYSAATSVIPLVLVYPSYGLGWFGRRAPRRAALIRTDVIGHIIFGLGLALGIAVTRRGGKRR